VSVNGFSKSGIHFFHFSFCSKGCGNSGGMEGRITFGKVESSSVVKLSRRQGECPMTSLKEPVSRIRVGSNKKS